MFTAATQQGILVGDQPAFEAVMERPKTGFVWVGTLSILFLSHNAGQ